MSKSMKLKRWLMERGLCTQCGVVELETRRWRCPGCSAKQTTQARERRRRRAADRMTQTLVPQCPTMELNA